MSIRKGSTQTQGKATCFAVLTNDGCTDWTGVFVEGKEDAEFAFYALDPVGGGGSRDVYASTEEKARVSSLRNSLHISQIASCSTAGCCLMGIHFSGLGQASFLFRSTFFLHCFKGKSVRTGADIGTRRSWVFSQVSYFRSFLMCNTPL